ncbi:hypothetical protein NECAME_15860 [Necator americanus]|uniref:Laminin EGF-like protein n=1 Tax=Necator americanus TaxID=51031 RepID=W2SFJ6_NECAM|nr:hypothetical protein NECAME_15860 [Necator americanus]ETN68384.1 hypothetical protein NECAME_15860 [Necator americanus]
MCSEPSFAQQMIENVVSDGYEDKNRNWWQSENGVQNVTVQLDLEAEFHFTHLIMTFKSFRPAAMIIERSADFGKTWQVYRYFAYDCAGTFPGIPEGPPKKHTDVICTRAYSEVAPSTGGELVYKVISPHIATENPYADEIANLLKITNLRFNFTKLHTLGDDLLDYRPEIEEKYYYAIYEIVVRGSCSCYGHASRCIPIDNNNDPALSRPDIVHGRCECMHNTEGLNCERCRDFYNDLPWRPAIGEDTNECRRCECNGHAARCHFDRAVYQASGFQSGGVCDDCQHNTQGKNCEQCKPFFYRDPQRAISDPYVCLPCNCDKAGSQDDGICEGEEDPERGLVAGKCYCKPNVDGPRCDRCKNGFWDLQASNPDGCIACTCHLLGTYNNEGCDTADSSYYCANIDHFTYEAENAALTNAEIELREHPGEGGSMTWTGEGFARANERSTITFKVNDLQTSQKYNIILRYDAARDPIGWENVQITVVRPKEASGECAGVDPSDDFLIARLHPGGRYVEAYPAVCLEAGLEYEIRVQFGEKRTGAPDRGAWILIDSLVLAPPAEELLIFKGSDSALQHKMEYDRYQCRNLIMSLTPKEMYSETCERYVCPVAAAVLNRTSSCDCDPTGSVSGICGVKGGQCECKPNVVGRRCVCNNLGSNLTAGTCDRVTGQCPCHPNVIGMQCDQCAENHYDLSSGQAVDFAQEDLKQLQTDATRLSNAADDLREKTNKIKEADVQGAYNITKESASRSLAAQRRTDAAIGKLAEAESEARDAEALLEKNKDDFEKQYAENEAALAESEHRIHILEGALPQLNAEVCGGESAPCDALCGGPGVCGFCGGQSCLAGAVSKADQARSFSLEADLKLNEKQKEAEEVLTLVRDVLHSTAAAKKDALEALEVARAAAQQTNSSRAELDQIVDQMNNFLKSSRSSPEQIRALAEEVLAKKISLTPEQIRDSLAKISNISAILAETRGNKTLASNLEAKALEASARAAAIKNTTDTVREAIQVAEEAQLAATEAIRSAEEVMKLAREHLDAAKTEADATEARAKDVNGSLSTLEGEMKKVKVQYLQIADDAKNAFQLVDKALQAAQTAEQGNKQMTMDIEVAQGLLSARTQGNEAPQKRAEALRQRASKLLYKAQRNSDDISEHKRKQKIFLL